MTTLHEKPQQRRTLPGSARYPVKRDVRVHYRNRHEYLIAAGSPQPPNLCEILGRHDDRDTMPWVTLVLGSGCLEIGSGQAGRALAKRIGDAFDHAPVAAGDRATAARQAQAFAESLVIDRLGSLDVPVPTMGADGDEISRAAPHLVMAACLLTRLFFSVKAARPEAVSRWDDDAVAIDRFDAGPDFDEIQRDVVPAALKQLVVARAVLKAEADPDDCVTESVRALLGKVIDGINGNDGRVELSLQQLRLVTEIAWYYLVGDKTSHPGWTDLLIRLMFRGDDPTVGSSRRPRPRFLNLKRLGRYVTELLLSPTERAWQRHVEGRGEMPAKPRIYDAAATVLWSQHEETSADRNAVPVVPPAVAFVTSFDLELEMALWAQSAGRSFSIAVPVHVVADPDDDEAELCWLLADIEPDVTGSWSDGLSSLRNPARWRVLRSQFDPRELRRRPIVVHLNGCPLLELPDLNTSTEPWVAAMLAEMSRLGLIGESGHVHMTHAVTVDEYLSLRQSEAELFWASKDPRNVAQQTGRSLPPDLTHDTSKYARFWMVLGVPVDDAAIRHRVTSQLTMRRFRNTDTRPTVVPIDPSTGMSPPPAAGPTSADTNNDAFDSVRNDVDGVVVNTRIDDDDASILHWLGLDVVHDGCEKFTGDLLHYAEHVRAASDRTHDTGCTLTNGNGAR